MEKLLKNLYVYNTFSGKKELFAPIASPVVKMYVCGITAYDDCHLGHARAYVTFDVIARVLKYAGYEVKYIRNVTDIDDKIIKRCREKGFSGGIKEAAAELSAFYHGRFLEDMDRLNCARPDAEPQATAHINEIIRIVSVLLAKGHAYEADGDIVFDVRSFQSYGALSKRRLDDMRAGSRVAVGGHKRDPLDFVLWKHSKEGEPSWESPWGPGRPGWHIECSAMSSSMLGETFDIHGGGEDLIFPHHENERAQSEACTGKQFARYWLHNGFITTNKEKMSKSLGNFFTLRELYAKFPPAAIRLFILEKHYRSQIDFTIEAVQAANDALSRIQSCMELARAQFGEPQDRDVPGEVQKGLLDDFNTAEALGAVFSLVKKLNKELSAAVSCGTARVLYEEIAASMRLLGLDYRSRAHETRIAGPEKTFASETGAPAEEDALMRKVESMENDASEEEIEKLIVLRNVLRSKKDFSKADSIRAYLSHLKVSVKDTKDGKVIWERHI